jgi:hypothetical protein
VIWYNNDAVRLSNEKISNFKIRDHVFNRIVKDNQSKNLVSTGFYEQLYSGRTTVFKKTVKAIQQKTDVNDGVLRFIDQKTYFYLYTSRGYFQINNKADVIEALADHKNQVKDFIGSNNLSYKKDPDDFLVKVAAYYDTL